MHKHTLLINYESITTNHDSAQLNSAAWKNCVSLASNVTAHKNPIGDKLYYTATSLFNNLSYTENGKLYYKMPGTGTFQVSSKIAIGGHMFFNIIP
ncbi:hypothetical protein [Paenibacillus sp. DCT19]|uniref:hypothetical protein n=1 Tax=Paenibacillus sp. DCT19 TaxID=2211212 RepID=UPI000FE25331|nr:hypothetical protein [Paenibacillus sp. DCT19]